MGSCYYCEVSCEGKKGNGCSYTLLRYTLVNSILQFYSIMHEDEIYRVSNVSINDIAIQSSPPLLST